MTQRPIDFEALGNPDFNLKGWINTALSSGPVNEPVEVQLLTYLNSSTETSPKLEH
jgi:hypothetical protein